MSSPTSSQGTHLEKEKSPTSSTSAAPLPTATNAAPAAKSKDTNTSSSHFGQKPHKWKKSVSSPPCNCVVLKNLDYNMTREHLTEIVCRVMDKRSQFTSMSLVEDKATGTFRGMAFVTFASVRDAGVALEELSKLVINGRKVVTEYRRTRANERKDTSSHDKRQKKGDHQSSHPGKAANANLHSSEKQVGLTKGIAAEDAATNSVDGGNSNKPFDKRALFFAKRDTERRADGQRRYDQEATSERDRMREAEFRKLLIEYSNGSIRVDGDGSTSNDNEENGEAPVQDMLFDATLTSYERRMVHCICEELHLGHISRTDESGNRVLHVTRDMERAAEWAREAPAPSPPPVHAKPPEPRTRGGKNGRHGMDSISTTEEGLAAMRRNYFRPRGVQGGDGGADSSGGILPPSYRVYTPKRQPSGPDGSIGFRHRMKYHGVEMPAVANAGNPVKSTDDLSRNGGTSNASSGGGGHKSGGKYGGTKGKGGKGRKQSMLNPSVPAFSPVNGTL